MKARVRSKFGRGFVLLEEHLLKIDDIITKRVASGDKVKVTYNVHRADDALITYDIAKDVITEDNSNIDRIKEIKIEAKDDHTIAEILFSSTDNTIMSIECDERDRALLLSSDLKSYLNSEICIQKLYWVSSIIKSRIFLPLFMMFVMTITVLIAPISREKIRVNSSNLNTDQKLDFIIQQISIQRNIPITSR